MKMKMKYRSHRCDINRLRPRRGLRYTKYISQYDDAYMN